MSMLLTTVLSASASFRAQNAYAHGTYVDDIICKVESDNTALYYHTDRQYNVRGLTDTNGDVVELYAYTVYGKQTILDPASSFILPTSSFNNAYGFTGRYHDSETALWYFRARYYSDELGRFISRDPLGYVDGFGLYGAYFAQWGGMDPSGEGFLSFVNGFGWSGDAADAFDEGYEEEIYDRANGTLDGLTLNNIDLGGYHGGDALKKAYTFDIRSREVNECFTRCWAKTSSKAIGEAILGKESALLDGTYQVLLGGYKASESDFASVAGSIGNIAKTSAENMVKQIKDAHKAKYLKSKGRVPKRARSKLKNEQTKQLKKKFKSAKKDKRLVKKLRKSKLLKALGPLQLYLDLIDCYDKCNECPK